MSALIHRVRQFIERHHLIRARARVVAAVSGGSDSTALLQILRELDGAGDLELAGVAHFNHQLRPAADDDERFVARVAADLGLAYVVDREAVALRAARDGRSIEDAARTARYEFLERSRVQLNADVVAVGHTRDDQAETFLLRLVRGAGPRGLAGIHPRHGAVVRPLLECRRQELRAWLARRHAEGHPGCQYLQDETNDDVTIPRNRVRAELLPLLVSRFNPASVDVLANEAELQRDLWNWMEDASSALLASPEMPAGALDLESLRRAAPALQRLVLWRAMNAASGGRRITFDHVACAIRLIEAEEGDGKALDLPGHRLHRIGGQIVLTSGKGSRGSANHANLFRIPLSTPGEVVIPGTGDLVSVEHAGDAWMLSTGSIGPLGALEQERCATTGNGLVACVRHDLVRGSLAVRNRRPGDRFRPVGLGGSKKLQDFFVDRKVARHERDSVPLVVDETDHVIWVAGHGIDEAFQVTDASQAVLVLRLTRAGQARCKHAEDLS